MSYNFTFAGAALSELYGVTTARPPREVAMYDFTLSDIPGRSGSEYIDNKRYKNVPFTREIGFGHLPGARSIPDLAYHLIQWLGYHQGYQEFEDSDHPGMVTYAVLTNFGQIQHTLRRYHTATLKFSRVPFWYKKDSFKPIELSGDTELSAGVTLLNPYPIESLPLIEVVLKSTATQSNSFTLKFGTDTYTYQISDFPASSSGWPLRYIYLDCETEVARCQANEAGDRMRYADVDVPPGLNPGKTLFGLLSGWSTTVDTLKIIPRWRCL